MTRLQRVILLANQPHAFKHRDVVRAIKAARAAGVNVGQVTVDPHTGKITMGPAQGANSTGINVWDEVLDAQDPKRP
jgi:hypothetical protein